MALLDSVTNVLAQYTSGTAAPGAAEAHFDEGAKSAAPATLAQGIAAVMHSDQTPPFASIVSKLFANASADQKAGMLNTLLASASPDQRAQLAAMIPGSAAGGTVTGNQAAALSSDAVASLASRVQQQGAGVVEKMSTFYAQHPTLVKTLGGAAMIIAMRKIAEAHQGS